MDEREAAAVATTAVECLGSPFEGTSHDGAVRRLHRRADASGAVIEALLASGSTSEARRVALAFAYVQALHGEPAAVLDPGRVPEASFEVMKLPRGAIRRMAAAAARCTTALRGVHGVSPAIASVRAAAWKACFGTSIYEAMRMQPFIRDQNVLLLGETGTGKDLIARAIAAAAPEPAPTQAINAAAIPRDLVESELFGHVKGSFTGAAGDREGKIVAANGGTLFLDEVGDLDIDVQPKLLRVIETNQVTPVGSNEAREVDVRYVSATSLPLRELVERGEFRRDLFGRLAGLTIEIPPLRDRFEDAAPIAQAILERFAKRLGASSDRLGGDTSTGHVSRIEVLQVKFLGWLAGDEARSARWPGNVRELENAVRMWLLGFDGTRAPGATPSAGDSGPIPAPPRAELQRLLDGNVPLREVEDWYISRVLRLNDYSQRKAARVLGIDRGTLARRLRQMNGDSEP